MGSSSWGAKTSVGDESPYQYFYLNSAETEEIIEW